MRTGGSSDSLLRLHSLVRLLKITRIVRFQRIMQRLQLVLYIKNSFLTVFNIATVFMFYTHCFACGFIYLARLENYEEHAEFKELKERHHADVQAAMHVSKSSMGMTGGMDELSEGVELLDVDAMCSYYVRPPNPNLACSHPPPSLESGTTGGTARKGVQLKRLHRSSSVLVRISNISPAI